MNEAIDILLGLTGKDLEYTQNINSKSAFEGFQANLQKYKSNPHCVGDVYVQNSKN